MNNSKIGGGIVALVVLVLIVFFLGRESGAPVLDRIGLGNNTVLVDRVIDGDTFVIANGDTVRIIGIDAPEGGECYAQESGQALTELLTGKEVRLEKDISGVDNFGRLLRHVHLEVADPKADNIQVGAYMLREGFAIRASSDGDNRYKDLLTSAQDDALEFSRGIWEACPDVVRQNDHLRQQDTEQPTPECNIKGNVSEKGFGRKYYYPGCPNYSRVKVDPERGDQWLCSEEEAIQKGYEIAENCPR